MTGTELAIVVVANEKGTSGVANDVTLVFVVVVMVTTELAGLPTLLGM